LRVGIGPFAATPSGLSVATVDTALALQAAGVEVTLFADGRSELPERAAPLRDRVVRLDPLPGVVENPRVSTAAFLPVRLALARRWARALAQHPVDVVHAFSPGTAAAVPRPMPVVVQAWFHPPRLRARLRTMLRFARRFPPFYAVHVAVELQSHASDVLGYRRADVVLANTVSAERAFRERGTDARHIPPCIALPTNPAAREPSDSFRVTFCADRLETPRKGLIHLLNALPLLERPVELTLFGTPTAKFEPQIEAARRAGGSVDVRGHVPRGEYLEHLARRTDLLAVMSLYEEWGYVLLEGFSEGVPALAFDLYPFFEIVDRDTGVLVTPGSERAVAAAIDAARDNGLPDRAAILRSTAERFGAESVAARLIPVYEQLAVGVSRRR
jgi:glycosyltransferase involved in cell wall biosynthesis